MVSNSALRAEWPSVGMKCKCVKTRQNTSPFYAGPFPELSEVYTVTEVLVSPVGTPSIALAEIPGSSGEDAPGWPTECFRPLVTKTQEQDVDAFRKLVDDIPLTEKIDRLSELLNQ